MESHQARQVITPRDMWHEIDRLRGLLALLEWAGHDDSSRDYCVVCKRYYGNPHKDDCWLGLELKNYTSEEIE